MRSFYKYWLTENIKTNKKIIDYFRIHKEGFAD